MTEQTLQALQDEQQQTLTPQAPADGSPNTSIARRRQSTKSPEAVARGGDDVIKRLDDEVKTESTKYMPPVDGSGASPARATVSPAKSASGESPAAGADAALPTDEELLLTPVKTAEELGARSAMGAAVTRTLTLFDKCVRAKYSSDRLPRTGRKLYDSADFVGYIYNAEGKTTAPYVFLQIKNDQWISLDALNGVVEVVIANGGNAPEKLTVYAAAVALPRFGAFDVVGVVEELTDAEQIEATLELVRQVIMGESAVPAGANPLGQLGDAAIYLIGDDDDDVKALVERCADRHDAAAKIIHVPQTQAMKSSMSLETKLEKERVEVKAAAKVTDVQLLWCNTSPAYRVWQAADGSVTASGAGSGSTAPANKLWANPANADPEKHKSAARTDVAAFIKNAQRARVKEVHNHVCERPGDPAAYASAEDVIGIAAGKYAEMLGGTAAAQDSWAWVRRVHNGVNSGDAETPANYFCATAEAAAYFACVDRFIQGRMGLQDDVEIRVRSELVPPREREFPKKDQWWMRFAPDRVRLTVAEDTEILAQVVVPCDLSTRPSKYFAAYLTQIVEDAAHELFLLGIEEVTGDAEGDDDAADGEMDNAAKREISTRVFAAVKQNLDEENAKKDAANKEALGVDTSSKDTAGAQQNGNGKGAGSVPEQGDPFQPTPEEGPSEAALAAKDAFDEKVLATLTGLPGITNFADMTGDGMQRFYEAAKAADPDADKYFPDPSKGIADDVRIVYGDAKWQGKLACHVRSYVKFYSDGSVGHLTGLYPPLAESDGAELLAVPSMGDCRFVLMDQPGRRRTLDIGGILDLGALLGWLSDGFEKSGAKVDVGGSYLNKKSFGDLELGEAPNGLSGSFTTKEDHPIQIGSVLSLSSIDVTCNVTDEIALRDEKVTRRKHITFDAAAELKLSEDQSMGLELSFSGGEKQSPMFTGKILDWMNPLGIGGLVLDETVLEVTLDPTNISLESSMSISGARPGDVISLDISGSFAEGEGVTLEATLADLTLADIANVYERLTGGVPITYKKDDSKELVFKNIGLLLSPEEMRLDCEVDFAFCEVTTAVGIGFSAEEGLVMTGSVDNIPLVDGFALDRVAIEMRVPPGASEDSPSIQGKTAFTIPVVDIGCELLCRFGGGVAAAAVITGLGFNMASISKALAWMDFEFPELMFTYSSEEDLQISVDGTDLTIPKGFTITGTCMFHAINKIYGDECLLSFEVRIENKKIQDINIEFNADPAGAVTSRMEDALGPLISIDVDNAILIVSFRASVTVFSEKLGLETGFQITFSGGLLGVNIFGIAAVEDPGLRIGAKSSTLFLKQVGIACQLLPVPGVLSLIGSCNFGEAASADVALRLHPTVLHQQAFMLQVLNASFRDILDLIPGVAGIKPLPKLPFEEEFGMMHQLKFSWQPFDMPAIKFGDIVMAPGLYFVGDIEAFGNRAYMSLAVEKDSFMLEANLRNAINLLNLIKLSNAEGDKGPSFRILIGAGVFELDIDGMLEILGMRLWARIILRAPSSLEFDVGMKILNITTNLKGKLEDGGSMYICFELSKTQQEKTRKEVYTEMRRLVREIQESAERAKEAASGAVEAYNNGLAQLQENLAEAQENLKKATELMAQNADVQIALLDRQQEEALQDIADIEAAMANNVSKVKKELDEAVESCRRNVANLRTAYNNAKRDRIQEKTRFDNHMTQMRLQFNRDMDAARSGLASCQREVDNSERNLAELEKNPVRKCCSCKCKHVKRYKGKLKAAKDALARAQRNFSAADKKVKGVQNNHNAMADKAQAEHTTKHAELSATEQEQLELLNEQEALYKKLTATVDASKLGQRVAELSRAQEDFAKLDRRFAQQAQVVELTADHEREAHQLQLRDAQKHFRKLKLLMREGSYTAPAPMTQEAEARVMKALKDLPKLVYQAKPHVKKLLSVVEEMKQVLKGVGVRYAVLAGDDSVRKLVPTIEEAEAAVAAISPSLGSIVVSTGARVHPTLSTFHSETQERDLVEKAMKYIQVPENFATFWLKADVDGEVTAGYEEFQLHYDAMAKSREMAPGCVGRVVVDRKGRIFEEGTWTKDDATRQALMGCVYDTLGIAFLVGYKHEGEGAVTVERFERYNADGVPDACTRINEIIAENGAAQRDKKKETPYVLMDENGVMHESYLPRGQETSKTEKVQQVRDGLPKSGAHEIEEAVMESLGIDFILTSGTLGEIDVSTHGTHAAANRALRALPPTRSYVVVDTRGVTVDEESRNDWMKDYLLDAGEKEFSVQYLLATYSGVQEFCFLDELQEATEALEEGSQPKAKRSKKEPAVPSMFRKQMRAFFGNLKHLKKAPVKEDLYLAMDVRGNILRDQSKVTDRDHALAQKAYDKVPGGYAFVTGAWVDGAAKIERSSSYAEAVKTLGGYAKGTTTVMLDQYGWVYDDHTKLRRAAPEEMSVQCWGWPSNNVLGVASSRNRLTRGRWKGKVERFSKTMPSTPHLFYGLVYLDAIDGKGKDIDISTSISATRDKITYRARSRTQIYKEEVSCLAVHAGGVDSGTSYLARPRREKIRHKQPAVRTIKFRKQFEKPVVCVGWKGICALRNVNIRTYLNVRNVTSTGFQIEGHTWSDSATRSMELSYFVYEESDTRFQSGIVTVGSWPSNAICKGKWVRSTVKFRDGFAVTPHVALAMRFLDVQKGANTRIDTRIVNLSKDEFAVEVRSWSDSKTWQVRFQWLAACTLEDLDEGDARIVATGGKGDTAQEEVYVAELSKQNTLRFLVDAEDKAEVAFGKKDAAAFAEMEYHLKLTRSGTELTRNGKTVARSKTSVLRKGTKAPVWLRQKGGEITFGTGPIPGKGTLVELERGAAGSSLTHVYCASRDGVPGTWYYELSDTSLVATEQRELYDHARDMCDPTYFVVVETRVPVKDPAGKDTKKKVVAKRDTDDATAKARAKVAYVQESREPAWTFEYKDFGFQRSKNAKAKLEECEVKGAVTGVVMIDIHGQIHEADYGDGDDAAQDAVEERLVAEAQRRVCGMDFKILAEGESQFVSEHYDSLSAAAEAAVKLDETSSYMLMASNGQRYKEFSYFLDLDWEELVWRKAVETLKGGLVLVWREFHKIRERRFYAHAMEDAFAAVKALPAATNRLLMDSFGNLLESASAPTTARTVAFKAKPQMSRVSVDGSTYIGSWPHAPIVRSICDQNITFPRPFETEPSIFYGLSQLDCDDRSKNTRLITYVDCGNGAKAPRGAKTTNQAMKWQAHTWDASRTWRCGISYLATVCDGVQTGSWMHEGKNMKGRDSDTFYIKFKKPFKRRPCVGAALIGLDAGGVNGVDRKRRGVDCRMQVIDDTITKEGFKVKVESGDGTSIWDLPGCYIAYDEDDAPVQSGTLTIGKSDFVKHNYYERKVKFRKGFRAAPDVCVALNGMKLTAEANTRITVRTKNVSSTGFTIQVGSWGDTRLEHAEVTWVAVLDEEPNLVSGFEANHVEELQQNDVVFTVQGTSDVHIGLGASNKAKDVKYQLVLAPGGSAKEVLLKSGIDGKVLERATAEDTLLKGGEVMTYWFSRDPEHGDIEFGAGDEVGRKKILVYEADENVVITDVFIASGGAAPVEVQMELKESRTNGFLIDTDADGKYNDFKGRVMGDTVRFSVRGERDLKVRLGTDKDPDKAGYELHLGANDNNTCKLVRLTGNKEETSGDFALCSAVEYREFWIRYDRAKRLLSVGQGADVIHGEFLTLPCTSAFRHFFVASHVDAHWCIRTDNIAYMTPACREYGAQVASTQPGQGRLRMNIKAVKDAFIGLAIGPEPDVKNIKYEVAVAPGGQPMLQVRDATTRADEWSRNILDVAQLPGALDTQFGNDIWLSWDPSDQVLRIGWGRQAGMHELVSCKTNTTQSPLQFVYMASVGQAAEWEVIDDQEYLRSRGELVIRTDTSFDGREFFALDKPDRRALEAAAALAKRSAGEQLRDARKKAPAAAGTPPPLKFFLVDADGVSACDSREQAEGRAEAHSGKSSCLMFDSTGCIHTASSLMKPEDADKLLTTAFGRVAAGAAKFTIAELVDGGVTKTKAASLVLCERLRGSKTPHVVLGPDGDIYLREGTAAQVDRLLRTALPPGGYIVVCTAPLEPSGFLKKTFLAYPAASDYYAGLAVDEKLMVAPRGAVLAEANASEALHAVASRACSVPFILCQQEPGGGAFMIEEFVDFKAASARAQKLVGDRIVVDRRGRVYETASVVASGAIREACVREALGSTGVGLILASTAPESASACCCDTRFYSYDVPAVISAAAKLAAGVSWVIVDSIGRVVEHAEAKDSVLDVLVAHARTAIAVDATYSGAERRERAEALAMALSEGDDTATRKKPIDGVTAEMRSEAARLIAQLLEDSRTLEEVDARILDFDAVTKDFEALSENGFCADVAELQKFIRKRRYSYEAADAFQKRADQLDLLTSLSADILSSAVDDATTWNTKEEDAFARMGRNIDRLREVIAHPRFDAVGQRDAFVVDCRDIRDMIARMAVHYPRQRPYIAKLKKVDVGGAEKALARMAEKFESNSISELDVLTALEFAARAMQNLSGGEKKQVVSEKQVEHAQARVEAMRQELQKGLALANKNRKAVGVKKQAQKAKYSADVNFLTKEVAKERALVAEAADILKDYLAASYEQEDIVDEQRELIAELERDTAASLARMQNYTARLQASEAAVENAKGEVEGFKRGSLARLANDGAAAMQDAANAARDAAAIYENIMSKSSVGFKYIRASARFNSGESSGLDLELTFEAAFRFRFELDLAFFSISIDINIDFSLTLNLGFIFDFIRNLAKKIIDLIFG